MTPTIHVQLLVPERSLFTGDATLVALRAGDGDIAFLANHAPFMATVQICVVKIERPGDEVLYVAVHGGFVRVAKNEVVILADVAELAYEIDLGRARSALARAEAELAQSAEDAVAEAALRRAEVRLEVASTSTRALHS